MNNLLTNEAPLIVLPKLAMHFGLIEAILLQQTHYWLQRSTVTHDDKPWIYNTTEQWNAQLPFITGSTIRIAFKNLRDAGVIEVAKLAKRKTDRTNYYTINYPALQQLIPEAFTAEADQNTEPDPTTPSRPKKAVVVQSSKPSTTQIPAFWKGRITIQPLDGQPAYTIRGTVLYPLIGWEIDPSWTWVRETLELYGLATPAHVLHLDDDPEFSDCLINVAALPPLLIALTNERSKKLYHHVIQLLSQLTNKVASAEEP